MTTTNDPKPYTGQDRRADDGNQYATIDRVELMIAETLEDRLAAMKEDIVDTINVQVGQIRLVFDQHIKDSFHDGDTHGHKSYHSVVAERQERWDKLMNSTLEKLFSAVVLAGAGFVGMALWTYFQHQVTK